MRLISVVIGEPTSEQRSSDTVKLFNYGFSSYKTIMLKEKNKIIGKVKVEKGKKEETKIALNEDAKVLLKISDKENKYSYKVNVKVVKAPLKKNQIVGTVDILNSNKKVVKTVNVKVLENIKKASVFDYFKRNLLVVASGKK